MDDEFGDDADINALLGATATEQDTPQKPQPQLQPKKVQQPKPQALPKRPTPSSILVSTRQKGNPILDHVKLLPWEYSDIPADYVLGTTTCALFLSLKYHRLHPEYIYARIRLLGHKYNLRILLIMVDIPNHEECMKELSKTSIVNNLTLMLCWSAPEAAHYLELFKSSEFAQPTAIRAQQASSYKDALVDFVTVPRTVNKTDAASLVSTFGSLREAVNAQPEQVGAVPGWGERKVRQWCNAVREDFRVERAKGRSAPDVGRVRQVAAEDLPDSNRDDEEAMLAVETGESSRQGAESGTAGPPPPPQNDTGSEEMSEGIMSALARLREGGG